MNNSPETIFWEVTNRCNLSCKHCYNSTFLNDKKYSLSLEEGVTKCQQFINAGVKRIIFLGGEPLADANIYVYIKMLTDAGVNVSITTNGTLINDIKAHLLASLKVSFIAVSIDGGNEELNDIIRGKGSFKKIVRGLQALSSNRINNLPRIALSCTLTPQNYGSYQDLFDLAKAHGIVDIFINKYSQLKQAPFLTDSAHSFLKELVKICEIANQMGNYYLYLPTMPRVADFLSSRYQMTVIAKEENCPAVDETLLLSDDGKLYPCSMARVEHPEYGTEYTQDLYSATQSENIQNFVLLRKHYKNNLPLICRNCEYNDTCATVCTLTDDQTKYYEACEALESLKVEMESVID